MAANKSLILITPVPLSAVYQTMARAISSDTQQYHMQNISIYLAAFTVRAP